MRQPARSALLAALLLAVVGLCQVQAFQMPSQRGWISTAATRPFGSGSKSGRQRVTTTMVMDPSSILMEAARWVC